MKKSTQKIMIAFSVQNDWMLEAQQKDRLLSASPSVTLFRKSELKEAENLVKKGLLFCVSEYGSQKTFVATRDFIKECNQVRNEYDESVTK